MDPLAATILVLIVTRQDIFLASDSLKVSIDQNGIRKTLSMNKIYQTMDYYYAVSGLDSSEDKLFSIQSIIHDTLLQFTNIDLAVKKLSHDLAKAIKDYVTDIRTFKIELFNRLLQYNASGGEIIILKNVGIVPTAFLLDYKIINTTEVSVILNTWKIDTTSIKEPDECFWRAIGNTSFLVQHHFSEKTIVIDPVAHARKLINKGIEQYPTFVGPPINILRLNKKGVQWVEKS